MKKVKGWETVMMRKIFCLRKEEKDSTSCRTRTSGLMRKTWKKMWVRENPRVQLSQHSKPYFLEKHVMVEANKVPRVKNTTEWKHLWRPHRRCMGHCCGKEPRKPTAGGLGCKLKTGYTRPLWTSEKTASRWSTRCMAHPKWSEMQGQKKESAEPDMVVVGKRTTSLGGHN